MGTILGSLYLARELELLPRFEGVASAPGRAARPDSAKKVAAEPVTPEVIEATTAEGSHRAELALAKVRQQQVSEQAETAKETLDEALEEAVVFDELKSQLLVNEDGKLVAANVEQLDQYVAIAEVDRRTRRELERWKSAVVDLSRPIEGSLEDPSDATLPPPDLIGELDRYADEGEEALEDYRSAREQLELVIAAAKVSGEKGTLTLKDAIARRRSDEALEEAREVEAARAKVRQQAAAQLAAQEAEKERVLQQKQLEQKQAEMKAAVAKAEEDRLRTLAESPGIQAKFAPLLTKGRWLFDRGVYSKISAPASYSVLVKQGYLRNYEAFARAMAGWTNFKSDFTISGYFYTDQSDRPRHKMPETEAEWVELKGLYDTFRDLAPVWVEMGLLAR
jgi:hypothetical protein